MPSPYSARSLHRPSTHTLVFTLTNLCNDISCSSHSKENEMDLLILTAKLTEAAHTVTGPVNFPKPLWLCPPILASSRSPGTRGYRRHLPISEVAQVLGERGLA